jgi:hypothetical protein
MNDCPNCEYHRQRAQRWRDEAYKQAGHPLPDREQEPVQVSPLEFVEMVMEKEHLIGNPIFWAEWPNKEKNHD